MCARQESYVWAKFSPSREFSEQCLQVVVVGAVVGVHLWPGHCCCGQIPWLNSNNISTTEPESRPAAGEVARDRSILQGKSEESWERFKTFSIVWGQMFWSEAEAETGQSEQGPSLRQCLLPQRRQVRDQAHVLWRCWNDFYFAAIKGKYWARISHSTWSQGI